jgi:hypothetical protein
MNTRPLSYVAAVSLALTAAVVVAQTDNTNPAATSSATTRAAVKTEAARARQAGEIATGESEPQRKGVKSTKTREQVRAEAREANAKGQTVAPRGEAVQEAPRPTASGKSRAEVRQEARDAVTRGQPRVTEGGQ